ncbi:MAG: hypothetical protein U5J78_02540 [Parasphingorhabdus sp.]|nr:hypothetical protein [Parasphingorhabdus sp.]
MSIMKIPLLAAVATLGVVPAACTAEQASQASPISAEASGEQSAASADTRAQPTTEAVDKNAIFQCQFTKAGEVIIALDEQQPTITVAGVAHPASSGSYFYQTTDDSQIVLMFGPGANMENWTYQGADGIPEKATSCARIKG